MCCKGIVLVVLFVDGWFDMWFDEVLILLKLILECFVYFCDMGGVVVV